MSDLIYFSSPPPPLFVPVELWVELDEPPIEVKMANTPVPIITAAEDGDDG